jgi:hypothetical protein
MPTFHARVLFDLGEFGDVALNALQQAHAQFAVSELTAAETQGHLDLVAFAKELVDRLHLRVIVMIVDVRAHLDLFDVLGPLRLAREIGLLLGLIFEFSDIEELGDGRVCVGRHLDQVESHLCGLFDRFRGEQHPEILAIFIDHAHFGRGDEFVEAGAIHRRRGGAPGERGTYSCFS